MLVTEKMIQAAFDWLNDHAGPAASAKAERIRAEYGVKRTKARLYLEAPGGNIAEREAWALIQDDFWKAVDREAEAVKDDEFFRGERIKCEAILEAFRTESANNRGLGRVG